MLKITPLGVDGSYPTKGPTSGYLVESDNAKILLDIGSGVFLSLINKIEITKLDALVISHFHFDHSSDIGVLKYYLEANRLKLKVYAPKDDSYFYKVILDSNCFEYVEITEGQKFAINGLLLDFYQMKHPVLTYGVKITDGKKTLSYTGDTNVCDNLDRLLAGTDLALMDSALTHSRWKVFMPHLSARCCAEYGKKYNLKVLLTHLYAKFDVNCYLEEALAIYDNCEIAQLKEYLI